MSLSRGRALLFWVGILMLSSGDSTREGWVAGGPRGGHGVSAGRLVHHAKAGSGESACRYAAMERLFRLRGGGMGSPKNKEGAEDRGHEDGISMMEDVISEAKKQALREEMERQMRGEADKPPEKAFTVGKSGESIFQVFSRFKEATSLEDRKAQSKKIIDTGKGIPVIAERLHDGVDLPQTIKPKFMVPTTLTLEKFVEVLRSKLPWGEMALANTQIRLTVRMGTVMPQQNTMGALYEAEKDEDGFLYVSYSDSWRTQTSTDLAPHELNTAEMMSYLEARNQILPDELDAPSHEYITSQFRNPRLRAVSIQQPLADAVLCGYKKVEGRHNPMKLPKKGGVWLALQIGRSLDHFTNYQVMNEVRRLWPQCPPNPVNRKRMGCIVGLIHIKECVPAAMCYDPWTKVLPSRNYLIIDQALALPRAIPHRHSFSMWTVEEFACEEICRFVEGRRGRLLQSPQQPFPEIWTEGYQWDPPKRRGRNLAEGEEGPGEDTAVDAAVPPLDGVKDEVDDGPLYPDEDEDLADSVLAASLAEHEEKDFWEQGMDEEEDEQAELRHAINPLEMEAIRESRLEKKWKALHPKDGGGEEASNVQTDQANADEKRNRIFFLQDIGPDQAAAAYRGWVRETAQTLREKYINGYKVSTAEWNAKLEEQRLMPVVYKNPSNGSMWDNMVDLNTPEEMDKIRWDELDATTETKSASSLDSADVSEGHLYDTKFDDANIQPAYMTEAVIDQLGIQPPEEVKKSVLQAMTPLTEEESRIMIAGENGTSVPYKFEDDQGAFRLRPAQLADLEQSSGEQEEGALYVAKVGKHRAAMLPSVKEAMKGMIGVGTEDFRKKKTTVKQAEAAPVEPLARKMVGDSWGDLGAEAPPKLSRWQRMKQDKKRIREMRKERNERSGKKARPAPPVGTDETQPQLSAAELDPNASEEEVE